MNSASPAGASARDALYWRQRCEDAREFSRGVIAEAARWRAAFEAQANLCAGLSRDLDAARAVNAQARDYIERLILAVALITGAGVPERVLRNLAFRASVWLQSTAGNGGAL